MPMFSSYEKNSTRGALFAYMVSNAKSPKKDMSLIRTHLSGPFKKKVVFMLEIIGYSKREYVYYCCNRLAISHKRNACTHMLHLMQFIQSSRFDKVLFVALYTALEIHCSLCYQLCLLRI